MTLTLAAWLHNLSPFALRFTDDIGLRWYGISYAVGFLIGWWWMRHLARRHLTPLSELRITDAMVALVIGAVAGGRLGYCLFYQPELFTQFDSAFPWWGVLRLNQGGMASHGGMIGVLIACYWIARGRRTPQGQILDRAPTLHVFDLVALVATPGLLCGRIANFINGELLGTIVAMPGQPSPWWAVKFPQEAFTGHAPPGQTQALAPLIRSYHLGSEADEETYARMLRLLQSGAEGSRELALKLKPLLAARHPSQLYQAAAEGLVIGIALWLFWKKPRTPGMVAALFLLLYGILRIATELIRLPDANVAVQRFAGLSRGQWLSAIMLPGALAMMYAARRWGGKPLGGWGAHNAKA